MHFLVLLAMKDPLKSCPGSTTETLTTNKPSFMHNLLCPMKPEQDASALSKSPSSSFPIKKPPSKHNMLHPIKPERDVPTFVSSSSSPIEQKPSFKPHELLYPMKPEQDGELLKWVNLRYGPDFEGSTQFGHDTKIHNSVI